MALNEIELFASCSTIAGKISPFLLRESVAGCIGWCGMGPGLADLAATVECDGIGTIYSILADNGIRHEPEYLVGWNPGEAPPCSLRQDVRRHACRSTSTGFVTKRRRFTARTVTAKCAFVESRIIRAAFARVEGAVGCCPT
ncbi:hypothetical protein [Paenirhodobacter populi]|uniref:Uncharacterized protein n=1 Tax=Paenirhodobacter populi TaxID=2306993 RepID=A0A443J6K3_9RHOB|nr:hypothetical protein [Sinirhodobacter populi]RWR16217.1 hypothetical protein D2T30_22165 [Sinirhodobacter populi]